MSPRLELAQTLHAMALIHTGTGRTSEAQRLFRASIDMAERASGPQHPHVGRGYYNLACLSAQAGERNRALELLREALRHGFAGAMIFDDPDLAGLRGDTEFEAILDEMRRGIA